MTPPYLPETRINSDYYKFETDQKFHEKAFELLKKTKSYVVVSGYQSDLYKDLYEQIGWERFDKTAVAQAGAIRTESVWISPRTFEAYSQKSGFIPEMMEV